MKTGTQNRWFTLWVSSYISQDTGRKKKSCRLTFSEKENVSHVDPKMKWKLHIYVSYVYRPWKEDMRSSSWQSFKAECNSDSCLESARNSIFEVLTIKSVEICCNPRVCLANLSRSYKKYQLWLQYKPTFNISYILYYYIQCIAYIRVLCIKYNKKICIYTDVSSSVVSPTDKQNT